MKKVVLYIRGKGGCTEEVEHYRPFFHGCDVIGLDYASKTPWEAKEEFPKLLAAARQGDQPVEIIANSIGAFFAMSAFSCEKIAKAYFISPVVDMKRLISDMMRWGNVTEEELQCRKEIRTDFGETLSWEYLCYVREHPVMWNVPTHILYGDQDHLTSYETISDFAGQIGATFTVMEGGEHWFHTEEQMKFLNQWMRQYT